MMPRLMPWAWHPASAQAVAPLKLAPCSPCLTPRLNLPPTLPAADAAAAAFDFWPACGFGLLQPDAQGWLQPTPAYIAAWLARPELALVPESCRAEIALHQALQQDPLRPVRPQDLAALADADARENYAHFITLRSGLLQAGTLQAWLLAQWRSGDVRVPPLFIQLVVQTVLRGLLVRQHGAGGIEETQATPDAFAARAAEMLFRPQRVSSHEGRLLAGDLDTLDLQRQTHGFGDIGRLLAQAQQPLKTVHMQVLQTHTQADYWAEAARPHGRHSFLLDLTHDIKQTLGHGLEFHLTAAHSGLKALAGVLQAWVQHLLGVDVRITPQSEIADPQWRWHVGLDAQASALLDDLYQGHEVAPERLQRLVSLFRLDFVNPQEMRADVAGKPVYLALCTDADQVLRMKPQNLLLNLPLAHPS